MTAALVASGVGYSVDDAVLVGGVDLSVEEGELVAVIGPNGAGKSTLLRLLAAELEPGRGSVAIQGQDAANLGLVELARLRALLPQNPLLRFGFRCRDVVEMGRYPFDETETESRQAAMDAMLETDTVEFADRAFPTLSGGEQARVSLARVLAQATPILLLDEPTASLDLRHQGLVMDAVRRRATGGAAIVVVLHDINLAARVADRVVVMSDGGVFASGPADEVLTEALVAEVYGVAARVVPHPDDRRPVILPAVDPRS